MLLWILGLVLLVSFYLHCMNQYTKGEEMMVYETDYTTRDNLLKECALKQPIVFDVPSSSRPPVTPLEQWEGDMLILSTTNTTKTIKTFVSAQDAASLLRKTEGAVTEGNASWIIENIPLLFDMRTLDALWRPSWTLQTNYDVFAGHGGATTRLRWHFDSSRFFYVSTGRLRIKMTPFYNSAYAKPQNDYSAFEFTSPLDVWSTTDKLAERMKFIDFEVGPGSVVYIPPYWWYSFQYISRGENETETLIYAFTYRTCVNIFAHAHHWLRWAQNYNTGSTMSAANGALAANVEQPGENSEKMKKNEKIDLFAQIETCGIENQEEHITLNRKQTEKYAQQNAQQNTIDVVNINNDPAVSTERFQI